MAYSFIIEILIFVAFMFAWISALIMAIVLVIFQKVLRLKKSLGLFFAFEKWIVIAFNISFNWLFLRQCVSTTQIILTIP